MATEPKEQREARSSVKLFQLPYNNYNRPTHEKNILCFDSHMEPKILFNELQLEAKITVCELRLAPLYMPCMTLLILGGFYLI